VSERVRLTPAIADIRRAVRESWQANKISKGTVAVACSGGPDSLALAAAAIFEGNRAKIKIAVVIINHNLQPGTDKVAERTAKLVKELGAHHVEVISVSVNKTKTGLEASARDARYKALAEFALRHKVVTTMLGHTLDDQAETVLLGLARGSGARSLSGMNEKSADGNYLRPLLHKFSRVKVRSKVLPVLEKELGPGISEALARTSQILQEDALYLDKQAEKLFSKAARTLATEIILDAELLAKAPIALANRVILKALAMLSVEPSRNAIESVMKLVTNWHGQKPLTLPGVRVIRKSNQISLKSTKTIKTGAC
jgi:tRNA(Ile)-lysidine synthase